MRRWQQHEHHGSERRQRRVRLDAAQPERLRLAGQRHLQEANTKQEALKPPPTGGPASGFEPFITQSLAITQPLLTQLEALTPPSNLQSDWDKLLADAKAKEALVQKALAAAKANDTSQFSAAIKQVQATAGQGDALAQSIGLTECAKNPQPRG
jgi:hypothetical protein